VLTFPAISNQHVTIRKYIIIVYQRSSADFRPTNIRRRIGQRRGAGCMSGISVSMVLCTGLLLCTEKAGNNLYLFIHYKVLESAEVRLFPE